jgi:uncharacterized protein
MTDSTNNPIRADGFLDAVLGVRLLMPGAMAQSDMDAYVAGGIAARIVDKPADDAVSRGVEIEGDDKRLVLGEIERLQLLPRLADGLRWARLTGGGVLLLIADDGGMLRDPLNPGAIKTIEEVRAYSAPDVTVRTRYNDPTRSNYGQPETYTLRVHTMGVQAIVHESRLIPIPGGPVPPVYQVDKAPWIGRAEASAALATLRDYRETLSLAREILRRKQQAVLKMKGLAQAIAAKMEDVVRKRVDMVDQVRSVMNGVAVDSEDNYTIEDTQLTGAADIVQEAAIAVSADSGIPLTILFGRSPAGMNATGDADFSGYHAMVDNLRDTRLGPAMERMVILIMAQKGVGELKDWSVHWPPLQQQSGTDEADEAKTWADARLSLAQALVAVHGVGMLSEEEGRGALADFEGFGVTAENVGDLPEPLEDGVADGDPAADPAAGQVGMQP